MQKLRIVMITAILLGLLALTDGAAAKSSAATRRPTAVTGTASAVYDTSATLNGTVNPRRSSTSAHFEWGTSTTFGSRTPELQVGSGRRPVSVSASLRDLRPGTTYYYRLVAANARGTSYGAASSFTTTGGQVPTPPPPSGAVCTDPYFATSNSNGGITDGGYYVHNNLWNARLYPGTTGTTQVCSYRSWNHIGTASNSSGDGAVKTYPNVHKDYSGRTIGSFPRIVSSFAATSPQGAPTYNVAYDLWLNGVPNDEVMIWTENHNQRPAGNVVARGLTFSGYAWDLWATSGNGTLTFAAPADATSAQPGWPGNRVIGAGTIDIKTMLNYLVSTGRTPANSTVDQICYGVEIVDTGGMPRTWNFTEFSITDS